MSDEFDHAQEHLEHAAHEHAAAPTHERPSLLA